MDVRLLGPLEVRDDDGRLVELGAPKLRAVLLALAVTPGHVVPIGRLIDDVWDEAPPPQALTSLRAYVSNLRRALGPGVVVTSGAGYVLDVAPDEVDAGRFEQGLAAARDAVAAGEDVAALAAYDAALGLWRGPALADVAELLFAAAPAARLEQLRDHAHEERLGVLLRLGRATEVVAEAQALVVAEPLRELPHRLLVLSLHQAGRTPEALDVHRDFAERLADELGMDPSPEFAALAAGLLRHDPALAAPRPSPRPQPSGRGTARAAAAPAPSVAPPEGRGLLGRERESARIDELVRGLVVDGHGGVLVVAGEAGIGKTVLLDHLVAAASAAGAVVGRGQCSPVAGAPPFWAWRQALGAVGAAVGELGPVADRLDGVGATDRFEVCQRVAGAVAAASGSGPLVLVVDDLHWADLATAELVAAVAAVAGQHPVLLVLAHRDTPADRTTELGLALAAVARLRHTAFLPLSGLAPDAVAALVARVAPTAADPGAVGARAGGNPFHATQLAQLVAETGDDAGVPAGVREVLAGRLAPLVGEARGVLEAVAVLGDHADPATVAQVLELDVVAVLDALDAAVRHGLVRELRLREPVVLVHALVRETLVEGLALGRLVRLHAAAHDALARLAVPPLLAMAEHAWEAADVLGAATTVAALRAAAGEAVRLHAPERAEDLLQRALRLLDHAGPEHDGDRLAVRVELVPIVLGLYGWTVDALLALLHEIRALSARTDAAVDLVPVVWSVWALHMTRGRLAEATELVDELFALVACGPHAAVAGHVAAAYTGVFSGADPAVVDEHLAAAVAAEAACTPEQLASVPEHLVLGRGSATIMRHALAGDHDATVAAVAACVAAADALGEPFRLAYAHLFAGWGFAALDDPVAARAHCDAGVAASEAAGTAAVAALIEPTRTWAVARTGGDAWEQRDRAVAADAALVAAGQLHAVPHGRFLLAELELLADDRDAGVATWRCGVELATALGETVYDRTRDRVAALLAIGPDDEAADRVVTLPAAVVATGHFTPSR